MQLNINHLQHTGIPVTDLARSEAFYQRLGFKNVMQAKFEFNSSKGSVIMMKLKDIIIELYQLPEAELTEIKNRSNGHIDHVAFDVDDIDEAFTACKETGFNMVETAPVFLNFWKRGCKYFNILGPDNERLEFNQIL